MEMSGKISMDTGLIASREISSLQTSFRYAEDMIEILSGRLETAGGSFLWEGNVSYNQKINLSGRAENINLRQFSGSENLKGIMEGEFRAQGSWEEPAFSADFSFREFSAGYKEFGHVSLEAGFYEREFNIEAFTLDGKYSLNGNAYYNPRLKEFSSLNLIVKDQGQAYITLSGEGGFSPFGGKGVFKGHSIPVADMPGLKSFYPEAAGNFNFEGQFFFRPGQLGGEARIETSNFSSAGNKYRTRASVSADLKDNGISDYSISIEELNGYLRARAELRRENRTFFLKEADVVMEDAVMSELAFLLGAEKIITGGTASGNINYSEENKTGKLKFKSPSLYGYSFSSARANFSFTEEAAFIEEARVLSGNGEAVLNGKVYPSQDITLSCQKFRLFDRDISLSALYTASASSAYEYRAEVSEIILNGEEIKDIVLSGWTDNGNFLTELEGEGFITAALSGEKRGEGEEVELSGFVDVENMRGSFIAAAAGIKEDVSGSLSSRIDISGSRKKPHLHYGAQLKGGEVKGFKADLNIKGEYFSGRLGIDSFTARAPGQKGIAEAVGYLSKDELDIVFSIENFKVPPREKGLKEASIKAGGSIKGTLNKPVVNYSKKVADINMYGIRAKDFSSEGRYSQGIIDIKKANIILNEGSLGIDRGKIDLNEEGLFEIHLNTVFKNTGAGPFSFLGGAEISGTVKSDYSQIQAEIIPVNLLVNRYSLTKAVNLRASSEGVEFNVRDGLEGVIKLTPAEGIEIKHLRIAERDKFLKGEGVYSNGFFKGSFRGERVEINDVLRILNSEIDLKGKSYIEADLTIGREKKDISGQLKIDEAFWNEVKVKNIGSSFKFSEDMLRLSHTYIDYPGNISISGEGVIGARSDFKFNIDKLSLAVLKDILPEITEGKGDLKGSFTLSGDISSPFIEGQLNLSGGDIRGKKYFSEITDINMKFEAEGSKIILKNFEADWAPGGISGDGYVDFRETPLEFMLLIKTEDKRGVSLNIPYLDIPQSTIFGRHLSLPARGEPGGSLRFYSEEGEKYIKGDIILSNSHFTYPPASRVTVQPPPDRTLLEEFHIDINMEAGGSVWYENTYARARVNGGLHFTKEPSGPLLVDGLLYSDQGTVNYFNREFELREVRVAFEEGREYIEGTAATRIRRTIEDDIVEDDEIEMRISRNRIADMEPQFSSARFEDITTQREATELALAGVTLEDLTAEERSMLMRRELLRAIDANLTTPLVQNILRQADLIDVARVDIKFEEDYHQDALQLRGAGLRVGRHLSDRFFMGYYLEYGLALDNPLRLSHQLDMSYRMRESQFLRGRLSGQEQFLGIEQRFRF